MLLNAIIDYSSTPLLLLSLFPSASPLMIPTTPLFSVGKLCQLPLSTLRQHHPQAPIPKLTYEIEYSTSHLSPCLGPSSKLSTPQTLNRENKEARDTYLPCHACRQL